jgi:hypothetical protein
LALLPLMMLVTLVAKVCCMCIAVMQWHGIFLPV